MGTTSSVLHVHLPMRQLSPEPRRGSWTFSGRTSSSCSRSPSPRCDRPQAIVKIIVHQASDTSLCTQKVPNNNNDTNNPRERFLRTCSDLTNHRLTVPQEISGHEWQQRQLERERQKQIDAWQATLDAFRAGQLLNNEHPVKGILINKIPVGPNGVPLASSPHNRKRKVDRNSLKKKAISGALREHQTRIQQAPELQRSESELSLI